MRKPSRLVKILLIWAIVLVWSSVLVSGLWSINPGGSEIVAIDAGGFIEQFFMQGAGGGFLNLSMIVNLSAPLNQSSIATQNVTLNWTVYRNVTTDVWCNVTVWEGQNTSWLVVEDRMTTTNLTNSTIFNGPLNFSTYRWNVTCKDTAGNTATSFTWRFGVSTWKPAAAVFLVNAVGFLFYQGWIFRRRKNDDER